MRQRILIKNNFEYDLVIDCLQKHDYYVPHSQFGYSFLSEWYHGPFYLIFDNASGEIGDEPIKQSQMNTFVPTYIIKKHLMGGVI